MANKTKTNNSKSNAKAQGCSRATYNTPDLNILRASWAPG
jgi:hypothetical protein